MTYDKVQYERMTAQYLQIWNLVWQIPSFTFTVAGALVAVSFQFLPQVPRVVVLFLASAFTVVMAHATLKHRVTAAVALQFLADYEKINGLTHSPIGMKEWIHFLKIDPVAFHTITGGFPEWIFHKKSEFLLVYLLLITSGGIFLLSILQLLELGIPPAWELMNGASVIGGISYAIIQIYRQIH